jgi:hypothetical protein
MSVQTATSLTRLFALADCRLSESDSSIRLSEGDHASGSLFAVSFFAVIPFLRAPLALTIAIAIASMASFGEANAMDQTDASEQIPDQIVPGSTAPSQIAPLDAFGYLGGLFEARLYQAHATTADPRNEIREAASLYGLDLAMMMSIAKVESDFNPRIRTGSYKGLFQLSDYEFNNTATAASGTRGTTLAPPRTCFRFKPKSLGGRLVATQITPRDTWCISRASRARLNTTCIPSALRGNRCVRPTRAF